MTRIAAGWLLALLCSAALAQTTVDTRRQGSVFMGASTQAMQKDDTLNPAMLWAGEGEALWNKVVGASGKSCAACHGAAPQAMRGVAARYPAFDNLLGRPVNLAGRINACRENHQQATPLRAESQELLSLEAWVALQSRGLPMAPPDDARLQAFTARGEAQFMQRIGQLGLSCAQCHDSQAGKRLGGSLIPEAHPTGYPVYRLEWQGMGSLQRRLRNCMTGVRAEPYAYGAQELVELELYLNRRAKGMSMEAPGVRP